ncbi:MAG: hypothetical protein QG594_1880 [Bacteroidota bacterium]|nr:hypothetical protein [Bacteroidota bacterium]
MKFAIFTHVIHTQQGGSYYAYAPYIREMNIWEHYCNQLIIVAPLSKNPKTLIDSPYLHDDLEFIPVSNFDLLSIKSTLSFLYKVPKLLFVIYKAMKKADHIHLRCPGNIGLLACLVQILFPNKPKTAKYAGNWDPKAPQPWTYKLQKKILNNTFLTQNMTVLVYGHWQGSSKNIKPFFTATYHEKDKKPLVASHLEQTINFVFVGTLVAGKNPLYAIKMVAFLKEKGFAVQLNLYGDGVLRTDLENYIATHHLVQFIKINGNQPQEVVAQAYQKSHFVVLPSKSEGWPKALAEGMFWGAVPLASAVSCVPFMLDYGNRGLLLTLNLEKDAAQITALLQDQQRFDLYRKGSADWSQNYTLELFESEIKKIMTDYY